MQYHSTLRFNLLNVAFLEDLPTRIGSLLLTRLRPYSMTKGDELRHIDKLKHQDLLRPHADRYILMRFQGSTSPSDTVSASYLCPTPAQHPKEPQYSVPFNKHA